MGIQSKIRLGSAFLFLLLLATGGTALFLLRNHPGAFQTMQAVVAFCGLAGFAFWINFPEMVAFPVKKWSADIRQIADGDYEKRLHAEHHDEFAEIAGAVNSLASKLSAPACDRDPIPLWAALENYFQKLEKL